MKTFVCQDFVTIRGNSAVKTITQGQSAWMNLPSVFNASAWCEVTELTNGGGTVYLALQTAPDPEDDLFTTVSGPASNGQLAFSAAPSSPLTVVTLARETLSVPVSRWFRWQLTCPSATGPWDITFRLLLSVLPGGKV